MQNNILGLLKVALYPNWKEEIMKTAIWKEKRLILFETSGEHFELSGWTTVTLNSSEEFAIQILVIFQKNYKWTFEALRVYYVMFISVINIFCVFNIVSNYLMKQCLILLNNVKKKPKVNVKQLKAKDQMVRATK